MTERNIHELASAIRSIAYGGSEPGGLEALAMAIAGPELSPTLTQSIDNVARALDRIADAIEGLGK